METPIQPELEKENKKVLTKSEIYVKYNKELYGTYEKKFAQLKLTENNGWYYYSYPAYSNGISGRAWHADGKILSLGLLEFEYELTDDNKLILNNRIFTKVNNER